MLSSASAAAADEMGKHPVQWSLLIVFTESILVPASMIIHTGLIIHAETGPASYLGAAFSFRKGKMPGGRHD